MDKRKKTEAVSDYVQRRIDRQNGVVGTVLCAVTIFMGFFILMWDVRADSGTNDIFDSRQAPYLLLIGSAVFAALIFILSRNDDKLSEGRRHLLSVIAIIIFDVVTLAIGFFMAGIRMADGRGIMSFTIPLLLVFGGLIYPFFFSLIAVPATVVLFAVYINCFAGVVGREHFSISPFEAMYLILLAVIVTIISLMNSVLQKKRFEVLGVYFNNVRTLLAARPNAASTIRLNVTQNEICESLGKGLIASEFKGAESIEEIKERMKTISPFLSHNEGYDLFTKEALLKAYDEGRDYLSFNWYYQLENGKYGWVTSNIRLIKNPATKDIEAIISSEADNRQHIERSILSILSDLDYIQIATIDIEKKTVLLYRSNGRINDGTFPEKDYEEVTRSVFRRLSAEYAGEVVVSERMMSLDTIVTMLSKKDVYQIRIEAGKKHYQEVFRYLDEFKKTILMTIQDITELLSEEEEKSERMREALLRARESSRLKGEFISRMSHDIRTPMSSIIGFSSLLERDKNDPEKISSDAKSIVSAGNELLSLVSDVLDIVKLTSKESGLEEREFSLDRAVRRVCAAMKPLSKLLSVDLLLDFSEISHENFIGAEERIEQILSNIITFVMDRTEKGGQVRLSVSARTHPSGKEENVSFEISGKEVVISEDYQEVIFEPFSRGEEDDAAKRSEAEGNDTGLGLAISKVLTELMGGNISVKSAPGEGCVFSVIIPLRFTVAEPLSEDLEQEKEERNVFDGLKILAAEDNELNAVLLREIMAMKGAETEIREDGEQVLSAFRYSPAGKFDVILMDVEMPVLNGHEAARAIRALESDMSLPLEKRREASNIPIIAMTANTFPEDVKASLNAGMNDHVGKPIDIGILGDAIRKSFYLT